MNVAYLSTRKRETEVIAGMSELLCGTRVARNKGTEGKRETVRPILIILHNITLYITYLNHIRQ